MSAITHDSERFGGQCIVNSAQMPGLLPIIYNAENAPAYWFLNN